MATDDTLLQDIFNDVRFQQFVDQYLPSYLFCDDLPGATGSSNPSATLSVPCFTPLYSQPATGHFKLPPKETPKPSYRKVKLKRTAQNRLIWTKPLQGLFLRALKRLGENTALPKEILKEMNVAGLTRENVASHLQKHRERQKKIKEEGYLSEDPEEEYEDDDEVQSPGVDDPWWNASNFNTAQWFNTTDLESLYCL